MKVTIKKIWEIIQQFSNVFVQVFELYGIIDVEHPGVLNECSSELTKQCGSYFDKVCFEVYF